MPVFAGLSDCFVTGDCHAIPFLIYSCTGGGSANTAVFTINYLWTAILDY